MTDEDAGYAIGPGLSIKPIQPALGIRAQFLEVDGPLGLYRVAGALIEFLIANGGDPQKRQANPNRKRTRGNANALPIFFKNEEVVLHVWDQQDVSRSAKELLSALGTFDAVTVDKAESSTPSSPTETSRSVSNLAIPLDVKTDGDLSIIQKKKMSIYLLLQPLINKNLTGGDNSSPDRSVP